MNKKFFVGGLILSLMIAMLSVFVSADDTLQTEADVYAPTIGVSVTGMVDFGSLTKGYSSADKAIEVNNTGDVNIVVTPDVTDPHDAIYDNLFFRKTTTSPLFVVGTFTMTIAKPTVFGGVTKDSAYVRLDLTNYTGTIATDKLNLTSNVVFTAVAA